MTLAARVVAEWERQGVSRVDAEELAQANEALSALEQLRSIELPATFRALWTLSDGTATPDDHEFTFWPLDNITSDPGLGPWRGLLVFADRRLGMRHFALRFDGRSASAVVDENGSVLAPSFDAFLERYLTDGSFGPISESTVREK